MNAPAKAATPIQDALSNYDKKAIRQYQKKVKKPDLSHIPCSRGWPILGHVYWLLTDVHRWINEQHAKHGPVFRIQTPRLDNAVLLLGTEANELIFQNEDQLFSNFLAWDIVFATLFDNNLLERDFRNHKTHRRILQSAFKREAIEGHIEIMNPLLRTGLQEWQTDSPIRMMDHIKQLLLDVGSSVFLGMEIGEESKVLNTAFTDIVAATADPFRIKQIWFSPYAKGVRGSKLLSDYIMQSIPERRNNPGRDLFSNFCQLRDEDGNSFTDEDIRDHIIFLLFAAHDTTTSAMSAVLFALASNEDWQEELRQEMLDFEKSELEFEDIAKLEKTGWTLKEALRMYPALTVMPRFALRDFEFNGYHIPANTVVSASALFTHYMPEYWEDPHKFDPMRFAPGREEHKKNLYQYIPFGGGAHKCLGLHFAEVQGKMFLFHLLTQFKVTKDPSQTEYKYNNVPLTFPTDGLPLTLHRL